MLPNGSRNPLRNSLPALTAIALAMTLQVQVSLFARPGYEGLRLALADLALPVLAIAFLSLRITKRTEFPRWQNPFGYHWIAAMIGILALAIAHGAWLRGAWMGWAITNKGIGFLVVMAYLGAGAWLVARYRNFEPVFIRMLIAAFVVISILTIAVMTLEGYGFFLRDGKPVMDFYRIKALMANRNTYALLFCCTAVFAAMETFRKARPDFILCAFWFISPAIFILSGSRVLWIMAPVLLVIFAATHLRKTLKFLLPLMMAGALVFGVLASPDQRNEILWRHAALGKLFRYMQTPQSAQSQALMEETGDHWRVAVLELAGPIWHDNPFLGSGVGAILNAEIEQGWSQTVVMDNSLFWIATEMGVPGLTVFIGCFLAMLGALTANIRNPDTPADRRDTARRALYTLLMFGFFSLFHEMLYTRFLWFILGMGLVETSRPHRHG